MAILERKGVDTESLEWSLDAAPRRKPEEPHQARSRDRQLGDIEREPPARRAMKPFVARASTAVPLAARDDPTRLVARRRLARQHFRGERPTWTHEHGHQPVWWRERAECCRELSLRLRETRVPVERDCRETRAVVFEDMRVKRERTVGAHDRTNRPPVKIRHPTDLEALAVGEATIELGDPVRALFGERVIFQCDNELGVAMRATRGGA
jgi:hypothetical protein